MEILYEIEDTADFGQLAPVPLILRKQLIPYTWSTYQRYHFGGVFKQEYRSNYGRLYFLRLIIEKNDYIYFKWSNSVHLIQYALKEDPAGDFHDGSDLLLREGYYNLRLMDPMPRTAKIDPGYRQYLFIELYEPLWRLLQRQFSFLKRPMYSKSTSERFPPFPMNYHVAEVIRKLRFEANTTENIQAYLLSAITELLGFIPAGLSEVQYLHELPDVDHKTQLINIRNNILYYPNISNHYISVLAKQSLMSGNSLWTAFNNLFGLTIHDLVRKTCMEKACLLLTTSKMSISEISYSLGYQHEKNFARAFKQTYDNPPHTFREKHSS